MFGFVLGISSVIYGGSAIRRGDVDQGKMSIIGGATIAAAPAVDKAMNAGALNHLELRWRALLGQLQTADVNLHAGLHQHGMDAIVRAHLERALAHIREACIAVNEQTKIRTVQELADQLTRIEQMRDDLRAQQTPADESSPSIHV